MVYEFTELLMIIGFICFFASVRQVIILSNDNTRLAKFLRDSEDVEFIKILINEIDELKQELRTCEGRLKIYQRTEE